jgi:HNH endonuclease
VDITSLQEKIQDGEIAPIMGHPDYYVSKCGDIYSTKRSKLRQLKPQLDQDGYPHVGLSTNSRHYTIKVQRLVALHFIGPKPADKVVCHNDGNKLDCSVTNLRYDTQRNNIADIYLHGNENPPRGSMNGMAKLTEDNVRELRRLKSAEGLSHSQLGERFGISREQARDIANRKYWRHV